MQCMKAGMSNNDEDTVNDFLTEDTERSVGVPLLLTCCVPV